MEPEYAKQKKQPYYMQIYTSVLGQIQSGVYSEGSKLPTEKEIAENYHVSRITSKKALDMLESEGIISRTPGKGSFVQRVPEGSPESGSAAGQRSGLIGVIIEKINSSFGGELILGMEHGCAANGCSMIVKCTYGSQEVEEESIKQLIEIGADGIVILCVFDEIYNAQILKLAYEQFPVVLVDRKLQGIPLPYVGTDNEEAAKEITNRLFEGGHERIAFVTVDTAFATSTIISRYSGFVESCALHGQIVADYQKFTGLLNHKTAEEWSALFDDNVARCIAYMKEHTDLTAYLVTSYDYAVVVEEAAHQMHKQTGRDYTVATFDSPETMPLYKKIMHIQQGQWEMGNTAIELLCKKIRSEEIPNISYIPYRLVE